MSAISITSERSDFGFSPLFGAAIHKQSGRPIDSRGIGYTAELTLEAVDEWRRLHGKPRLERCRHEFLNQWKSEFGGRKC